MKNLTSRLNSLGLISSTSSYLTPSIGMPPYIHSARAASACRNWPELTKCAGLTYKPKNGNHNVFGIQNTVIKARIILGNGENLLKGGFSQPVVLIGKFSYVSSACISLVRAVMGEA